jgi:ATP-dependent DNA ligase
LPSTEGVFADRLEDLLILGKTFEGNSLQVVQTGSAFVEMIDEIAMKFIDDGYEGAMVRLNKPYENKRSPTLIKWKQFTDEEFKIVDVLAGRGNKSDKAASILLELPDGRTFNAGVIGNDEYAAQLLKEKAKVIGKMGTVVYFHLSEYGVPRFPKMKCVRWDV